MGGAGRLGIVAVALGVLGLASGCNTVCGSLKERAVGCGTSESRYVDERDSICTAVRRDVGRPGFDAYARCVEASSCDDGDAIPRCTDALLTEPAKDPCTRYRLWAAGCGLEPVGTENSCNGIGDTIGASGFATWVGCITADGCPAPGDDRYERCQNILPPEVNALLEACNKINEWTTACDGKSPSAFPVTATSVPECLGQAQPFAVSSYVEYADCLSVLPCDDIGRRLDCILGLRLLDQTELRGQCQTLINYTSQCGSNLGGNSVDTCSTLFARFTPESMDAYVACVTALDCGDANAGIQCGALLVLQ